ncbi:hypothetical protein DID74_02480 [Candidatus Marinamargulisbacteria bacterium SCGC AG-333-B06]|nr:hypothetical protein DID74_02480 [Candidatus Marinamargulisbacteria bacterium SCGC AG-333-B06]
MYFAYCTASFIIILSIYSFHISNKIYHHQLLKKNKDLNLANLEIAKKSKLEAELELGRKFQEKYLTSIPETLPSNDSIQLATYYNASKKLGGDYYYAKWNDNYFQYALVDVTGKGIQSALMTISIHALIRNQFYRIPQLPINEMMYQLNNSFLSLPTGYTACDTFLLSLNINNLKLSYINCALESAYVIRNQTVIELNKGGGLKPGLSENENYTTASLQLKPNDLIVLATDGIIDMTNKENKRYSHEKMKKFLIKKSWKDEKELKSALINDVQSHQGKTTQNDDIAMLIMKV